MEKARKPFVQLTLASNDKKVIVSVEGIAFAAETAGENETTFTRIFFKQLVLEDSAKWVDVKETPEQILKAAM